MKNARTQIIFFVIGLISFSAAAQSKKRLDFNSYLQENFQIISHNQKGEKNQLAFDELLPRTPAETTTNVPDFNNIKGNDSIWNSMSNSNSNSQNQNNQPAIQVAPLISPSPAATAPAAPSGENPNQ